MCLGVCVSVCMCVRVCMCVCVYSLNRPNDSSQLQKTKAQKTKGGYKKQRGVTKNKVPITPVSVTY